MIRYQCDKCKEKLEGGPEDHLCPLCGGSLIIIGVI